MKAAALGLAAMALAGAAQAAEVRLECAGVGTRPTSEVTHATVTNSEGQSASGFATTAGAEQVAGAAGVLLSPGAASVRVPQAIVPPVHSGDRAGWWDLYDLKESETEITGRFRLNVFNKPQVRINRLTGAIEMAGSFRFAFSGVCRPASAAEKLF